MFQEKNCYVKITKFTIFNFYCGLDNQLCGETQKNNLETNVEKKRWLRRDSSIHSDAICLIF